MQHFESRKSAMKMPQESSPNLPSLPLRCETWGPNPSRNKARPETLFCMECHMNVLKQQPVTSYLVSTSVMYRCFFNGSAHLDEAVVSFQLH